MGLARLSHLASTLLGRTPLLYAAWNGHEAVVNLLLATENIDIDSRDNLGQTPLSRAAQNGQEVVVVLLATENVRKVNTS